MKAPLAPEALVAIADTGVNTPLRARSRLQSRNVERAVAELFNDRTDTPHRVLRANRMQQRPSASQVDQALSHFDFRRAV